MKSLVRLGAAFVAGIRRRRAPLVEVVSAGLIVAACANAWGASGGMAAAGVAGLLKVFEWGDDG